MTSLSELKFFTTPEHDCSYLDKRMATTLFADPSENIDRSLYTELSAFGFRRSGHHIYRPHCGDCQACIALRVPVYKFKASRSQKRILRKNRLFKVVEAEAKFTEEYFELYERYIRNRHADGDMYPPDQSQFISFLVDGRPEAVFYEFRSEDKLIAVAVVDKLDDGLSAIYTFFETNSSYSSLGVFAILWLINVAKDLGLPYLYMGYWIKACQKMSYKTDYNPHELFIDNHWLALDD